MGPVQQPPRPRHSNVDDNAVHAIFQNNLEHILSTATASGHELNMRAVAYSYSSSTKGAWLSA